MKINVYYDVDKLLDEDSKCYRYVIRQQERQNKELVRMIPRYTITDVYYENGEYAYGVTDNLSGKLIEVFSHEYKAERRANELTTQAKINGEPILVYVITNRRDKIIARYPVTGKGGD